MLVRRGFDRRLLLQVVRDDQTRDGSLRLRDPQRPVDEVAHLRGIGRHVHVLVSDVLEERDEVDLLLVVAAQGGLRLLADDRDQGLVVELRVVEPVEEVDRARAGGSETDADLAGELRVCAGHERRHLLVPDLDELEAVDAFECADDAVDAVARVAVDPLDAPLREAVQEVVGYELWHEVSLRSLPIR